MISTYGVRNIIKPVLLNQASRMKPQYVGLDDYNVALREHQSIVPAEIQLPVFANRISFDDRDGIQVSPDGCYIPFGEYDKLVKLTAEYKPH